MEYFGNQLVLEQLSQSHSQLYPKKAEHRVDPDTRDIDGMFTVSRKMAPGYRNNDWGSRHFLLRNFDVLGDASVQLSVLETHISSIAAFS